MAESPILPLENQEDVMTVIALNGQAFIELFDGYLLWIAPMEELPLDDPEEVMVLVCKALQRKQINN